MRRSEERKSAEERGSTQSQRNTWRIRESDSGRNSSDVRETSVAKLPSKNEKFAAAGCLKGEECYEKPKAIHRLFEEMLIFNSSHDTTALIYGDEGVPSRETKYGELNSNANQIANLLLDTIKLLPFHPNQDGDFIIGVVAKSTDTLIAIILGILKTGAAYMPIDPLSPKRRIEHILNESKPILVVYDDEFKNVEVFSSVKTMKFVDILREASTMKSTNITEDKMFTKENDLQKALICYTSGSTGVQKGVRLSHFTLFHRMNWQLITFPFTADEQNCVFKTSTFFIDHVSELWCPLVSSKTLVVVPRDCVVNPEKFIAILHERQVQRLLIVPSLLRNIFMVLKTTAESTKSKEMLSHLRLWISSGEVLTKSDALDFFEYYKAKGENILVNFYGATEALDCTVYELASEKQLENLNKIPIGLPVHNTLVYVIDPDTKEPVEEGESGEICVSGLTLADGYVNGRALYAFTENVYSKHETFQRLYHTGDFGNIIYGMLYFEGREDSQVKINGMRVDLQEISSIVEKLEYVQETVTLAFHKALHDQAIISFIATKRVFDKPVLKDPEDILRDLSSLLVNYMMPKIFIIDRIPRLSSGKINQSDLLQQYESTLPKEELKMNFEYDLKNISRGNHTVAKKVFETIGVALGNDAHMKLNFNSNFYRLGGSSLNTITTVYELRQSGYHVDINEFLKARTIGEIISHVSSNKTDSMKVKPAVKFIVEPFNALERSKCIQTLSAGYFEKLVFSKYIPNIKKQHFQEMLNTHWDFFIKQNFSFMVKNVDDEVIGVTLLTNVNEKLAEFSNTPVKHIFEFISSIEGPTILNMITESCLHVFMMATSPLLNPHTTIALLRFMETKVVEIATKNNFKGILTTNTDKATIEIGSDFGYKIMNEYQINRYTDKEGKKPFINAPENQVVAVMFKNLK